MASRGCLHEAEDALGHIAERLGDSPTRVIKFGSEPHVLTGRSSPGKGGDAARSARKHWDASSGGTYMWKMIERDILGQYVPASSRLRVFIITDGMDELSPWAYQGLAGMHVMKKTLSQAGFDIEFFIVVVGAIANMPASEVYRELACSSGGAFLRVGTTFNINAVEARAFMAALAESSGAADAAAAGRETRRLDFDRTKQLT